MTSKNRLTVVALMTLAAVGAWPAVAEAPAVPTFTQAQADDGAALYGDNCAKCHGPNLNDGEFGPPLKGARFKKDWGGKGVDALFSYAVEKMPPGQTGVLRSDDYAALLAYILAANGAAPGDKPLPDDAKALADMTVPN